MFGFVYTRATEHDIEPKPHPAEEVMEQPASDFDGAWKYALEQYFAPFLELFFPEAFAAIDWSEPVAFRDTELQQIAPED
jgi:hypothetical protein